MKTGLSSFAADARANGGELQADPRAPDQARAAVQRDARPARPQSGVRIDDTPFIEFAQRGMREIQTVVERGIARGEIDLDSVFDTHYVRDARHQSDPV